jgi:hypothetical protein
MRLSLVTVNGAPKRAAIVANAFFPPLSRLRERVASRRRR